MDAESSYDIKLKDQKSKLTKSADACHDCIKEKGFLEVLAKSAWQKWNSKTFKWETPE